MILFSTRRFRVAALAGIVGSLLLGAVPAQAAATPTLSASNLTASVHGFEVTASTTVKSSAITDVDRFGVCVRGANKLNVDFVKLQHARVTPSGTTQNVTNESWNGALGAGASATFGFLGSGSGSVPSLTCTPT